MRNSRCGCERATTSDAEERTHERGRGRRAAVTILTGFLGSGKTTLLNYILREQHGRRIAVIENEFGEIDIDSDLVVTSDEEIIEMSNGCICCVTSVRTDLLDVVRKLVDRVDYILIEASGLADPDADRSGLLPRRSRCWSASRSTPSSTLVDAKHIEQHLDDVRYDGIDNQAVDQIVCADRIIINKVDLVDEADVERIRRRIAAAQRAGRDRPVELRRGQPRLDPRDRGVRALEAGGHRPRASSTSTTTTRTTRPCIVGDGPRARVSSTATCSGPSPSGPPRTSAPTCCAGRGSWPWPASRARSRCRACTSCSRSMPSSRGATGTGTAGWCSSGRTSSARRWSRGLIACKAPELTADREVGDG